MVLLVLVASLDAVVVVVVIARAVVTVIFVLKCFLVFFAY